METYYYWLIAAIVLVVVEIFTSGFAVLCFAIGALFGALTDICGFGFNVQLAVAIVGAILSFLLVRPVVLRYMLTKKSGVATNVDALIGRQAVVSEHIDASLLSGRVAVDGDDWRAESEDGTPIAEGSRVTIVKRESLVLTVKNIES